MNNAPTEKKKRRKRIGTPLLAKAYPSLDEYRETQQFCLPTADPTREREEVLEIRSAAEAARRPTDNKMITREYTGNYRNDNDEENDDNNGDSVDEGEGG